MTMITNTATRSAAIASPGFRADAVRGLAGRCVRLTA